MIESPTPGKITTILRTSASDEGSILDTSACSCSMQCVNAICGATLLIKPFKPDLHPIIAGDPLVHTAETIFQERSLLVKKSPKYFSHQWPLQLLLVVCERKTL